MMILRRFVSVTLIICLVVVLPGNGFYSALGQVMSQSAASGAISVPLAVPNAANIHSPSFIGGIPGRLDGLEIPSLSEGGFQIAGDQLSGRLSQGVPAKRLLGARVTRIQPVSQKGPLPVSVVSPGSVAEAPAENTTRGSSLPQELSTAQISLRRTVGESSLVNSGTSPGNVQNRVISIAEALGFLRKRNDDLSVSVEPYSSLKLGLRPHPGLGANSTGSASQGLRLPGSSRASVAMYLLKRRLASVLPWISRPKVKYSRPLPNGRGFGFFPGQGWIPDSFSFTLSPFRKMARVLRRPDVKPFLHVLGMETVVCGTAYFLTMKMAVFFGLGVLVVTCFLAFHLTVSAGSGRTRKKDIVAYAVLMLVSFALAMNARMQMDRGIINLLLIIMIGLGFTAIYGFILSNNAAKRMRFLPSSVSQDIKTIGKGLKLNWRTREWVRQLSSYAEETRRALSEMKKYPEKARVLKPIVDYLHFKLADPVINSRVVELSQLWGFLDEQKASAKEIQEMADMAEASAGKGNREVAKLLDRAQEVLGKIDTTSLLGSKYYEALNGAIVALRLAQAEGSADSIAMAVKRLKDQLSALLHQPFGFLPALSADRPALGGVPGFASSGLGANSSSQNIRPSGSLILPPFRAVYRFLRRPDFLAFCGVVAAETVIFGVFQLNMRSLVIPVGVVLSLVLLPSAFLAFSVKPPLRTRRFAFITFLVCLSFFAQIACSRIGSYYSGDTAYPWLSPVLAFYVFMAAALGPLAGHMARKEMEFLPSSKRRGLKRTAKQIDLDSRQREWMRGLLGHAKERRRAVMDMKKYPDESKVLKPVIDELSGTEINGAVKGEEKDLLDLWEHLEQQGEAVGDISHMAGVAEDLAGDGMDDVTELLDRAKKALGRIDQTSFLGGKRHEALDGAIGDLESARDEGDPNRIGLAYGRLESCLDTVESASQ